MYIKKQDYFDKIKEDFEKALYLGVSQDSIESTLGIFVQRYKDYENPHNNKSYLLKNSLKLCNRKTLQLLSNSLGAKVSRERIDNIRYLQEAKKD